MKTQAEQLDELQELRYRRPEYEAPSAVPGLSAVEVSDLYSVDTGEDTLVRQEFRDEVDVNTIMRRFGVDVGRVFGPKQAMYGDFTDIHDFESAVAKVDEIRGRFMQLPAEVREKFQNDPQRLISAVERMTPEEFDEYVAASPAATPVATPVVDVPST